MKNGIYYDVFDVMGILAYKKSKAYSVINDLNQELKNKGRMVRPGLIPKNYFDKRFGIA